MPDNPLNPDALEKASREVFREVLGFDKSQSTRVARRAIAAYLAVAQPVVNTVEELDQLPLGTIIEDSDDDCVLQALERGSIMGTEWYIPGVEKIFTSKDVELPARVLYRPAVKS